MFWEEASKCMTDKVPDQKEEPYPVFFNIDEFGNLNRVNQIRKNLSILRKYRVRTAIYFQYKSQAAEQYTKEEMDAFFSVKTKLVYTQANIEDANYFSPIFGQTTKSYKTKQNNSRRTDTNYSQHLQKLPLVSPDDLMDLKPSECLISISGKRAIKASRNYYYKNSDYSQILKHEIDFLSDSNLPNQNAIMPKVETAKFLEEDMAIEALNQRAKDKRNDKRNNGHDTASQTEPFNADI